MQEFRVHFMPGTGALYGTFDTGWTPNTHDPVTVEGHRVNTQATNGAGLVTEVFKTPASTLPTHVFSNVLFVESLGERDVPGEDKKPYVQPRMAFTTHAKAAEAGFRPEDFGRGYRIGIN